MVDPWGQGEDGVNVTTREPTIQSREPGSGAWEVVMEKAGRRDGRSISVSKKSVMEVVVTVEWRSRGTTKKEKAGLEDRERVHVEEGGRAGGKNVRVVPSQVGGALGKHVVELQ